MLQILYYLTCALNIKRALYNDMLGNPDRTPASATEVAERMADFHAGLVLLLVDCKQS
jgi:hypothetical protein